MKNKLTATAIKNSKESRLYDGGGLMMIKKGVTGTWYFRYSHLGKRRDMGLGTWPDISLATAREARDKWAAVLAEGIDPISKREEDRLAEIAERDKEDPTFAEMVDVVFEQIKGRLRGGGVRGRWRSPLDIHVIPKIGRKRMSQITQMDIKDAIKPIWRKKHPTAEKAIQRTRIVFNESRYAGISCDPFTVDAAERLLGDHNHEVTHIEATDWRDVPALWNKLDPSTAAGRCLQWMLLTLVRFDGCRMARTTEVKDGVWIVPKERVKGREGKVRDFRVPLPEAALEIVREAEEQGRELMFPGRRNKPITSRGIEVYLDRVDEPGRPHGFRTAFRTWVQDNDVCSFEVAETILNHKIGSTVERSYARSDLLDRRAPVMETWANYVLQGSGNVVSLRRA